MYKQYYIVEYAVGYLQKIRVSCTTSLKIHRMFYLVLYVDVILMPLENSKRVWKRGARWYKTVKCTVQSAQHSSLHGACG